MAKTGIRRDSKHRVLRRGESIRWDGKYQFKYHVNGKAHFVYSWRLEPTDKFPAGKKPCLSLRELEKQIGYDLDSQMHPEGRSMTVEELVERYLSTRIGVKPNTKANYNFVKNLMKKEDFYYKMAEVGGIISLIYEQMGEKENSIEWQEKSLKCIKKGVEYFNIETYELKSISSSYVQEVKVLSNDVVFGFLGKLGHPIGYTYETVISEEGEKFIEDSKKELIRKFSNNLKSMKFEI